jgi:hypothetical protein
MRTYLIFPMILPRLIHLHFQNLVVPFAIGAAVVECYAKTLREVLR